jgi:hypothetical protein
LTSPREDGKGTLTVRDYIDYMTKKNRNGIPGYEYPKFDAKLDKSPCFVISNKRKKETYLDEVMRQSK